jgi:hypothetical protein
LSIWTSRGFYGLALATLLGFGVACGDDNGNGSTDGLINPPAGEATLPPADPPPINADPVDRAEFIDNIEAQLSQVEIIMLDVEAEALSLEPDLVDDANERIDELRASLNDLYDRLSQAEVASDEEFEAMRSQIEDDAEQARIEVENLATELGI